MGVLVCVMLGAHEVGSLQGSCFPQLSGSFEDHFQGIPVLLV